MHPAVQLIVFGERSKKGCKETEIADLLGYSTRHVKKCLRLAEMASVLLDELANDKITLDQLQALSISENHERQINVWNNASGWKKELPLLRQIITQDGSPAAGNVLFKFVGKNEYKQADSEDDDIKRSELHQLSHEKGDELEHIEEQSEILAWTL
ncbi:hypothetical protein Xvie_03708 [Xenorhabdus vietnamensis]|uniref:DNA-binding protein n=2 Tax=Xenorhabdus vietnamensis TaxID=351656 RepID=A0A1Y2S8H7_9GAMM|nr:hypothetical protein Xvie_03708 [Xenorhabdus vietnamensis]